MPVKCTLIFNCTFSFIIRYLQNFDLEGESGIVARGIGTAVTLVKVHDVFNSPSDNVPLEEYVYFYLSI